MRTIAVLAAALVVAFAIAVLRPEGGSKEPVAHSCGATDRRFIVTASANMLALGIWADGYRSGDVAPEEVAGEARDAAERIRYISPTDPSLREAQRLIDAMFSEYGQAVSAFAKGEQAGDRMRRAYGLANFARAVLVEAQPELARRGCDLTSLL